MSSQYEMFFTLCTQRKSCRRFAPDSVSEQDIERILNAGKTSPFASGRRNWEIVVVRDKTLIDSLTDMVTTRVHQLSEQMEDFAGQQFRQYGRNFSLFSGAPVLFLPTFRVAPTLKALLRDQLTPELELWERDNAVKSISCVSMLILLAAQSLGLGACYMTGPLVAADEMARALGLPPERQVGAIIPVGKPLITSTI